MFYTYYDSPIGRLLLAGTEIGLSGIWFEGQKYYAASLPGDRVERDDLSILKETKDWLDRYFARERPDPKMLSFDLSGTPFRREVWDLLLDIPYGKTTSYGAIADTITRRRADQKTSARAVGGAVGHNPVSIIIPCHRVMGHDGSLTGFAGGVDKKLWLLRHEGVIL